MIDELTQRIAQAGDDRWLLVSTLLREGYRAQQVGDNRGCESAWSMAADLAEQLARDTGKR